MVREADLVSANVRQHAGIAPFAITVVAMLIAAGVAARFALGRLRADRRRPR